MRIIFLNWRGRLKNKKKKESTKSDYSALIYFLKKRVTSYQDIRSTLTIIDRSIANIVAPNIKVALSFSPFSFRRRYITEGITAKTGCHISMAITPVYAVNFILFTVQYTFSSFFSVVTSLDFLVMI